MNRSRLTLLRALAATLLLAVGIAVAVAGCGSSAGTATQAAADGAGGTSGSGGASGSGGSGSSGTAAHPHPQAVEPVAGAQATPGAASAPAVGDVNAHAPSLTEVKRELKQLNLCGGTTDRANAAPLVKGHGPGFVADPGTQQSEGQLPILTADLNTLAKALGVTIYGISGYRSPAHSVAVGGFADDPHTQGMAEDIGVNSLLRSSAAQISESDLARYGLYRPFDPSDDPGNTEVNHVQLIPSGGVPSLTVSEATWDPDPSCQ